MALLAQTCSKIGTEEVVSNNQNIAQGIRVVNATQGVGGEIIAPGWVQLPNVGDAKQVQGSIPVAGGQILQQPQGGGLQLVATQGPNGQISYVATQNPVQAVNVEGQEGSIVIPSSGAAGLQNQFITVNQQQQGIPIMTANGQIIRAQMPAQPVASNVVPSGVFANVGGNMVNLGGNIVNLGGVQNLGAIRPAGAVMQAVQMPQQVQQLPQFIQVPVSANGQTALMPVQVAAPSIQTVQDLNVTASGVATVVASSTSAQTTAAVASSQTNIKSAPSTKSISGTTTQPTPLNIPVVSFPHLTGGSVSGQQTVATPAANILPQMQLIPVGGGNFVQAVMPSSQTNLIAGQNVFTLGSMAQSGITTATATTASTSTVASAQQQSTVTNVLNQVPQIIQTLNGQNLANIQIAGQNQVIASPANQIMQAINLANLKNQIPVQVQNIQGMQALQNLQSFQTINAQGQIQQVIGTPITGLQVSRHK